MGSFGLVLVVSLWIRPVRSRGVIAPRKTVWETLAADSRIGNVAVQARVASTRGLEQLQYRWVSLAFDGMVLPPIQYW